MAASHQDATGASLLARIMYWWNGTNAVPVDTSNPLPAGGNVASGATDAGNPLKVGGKYNSTKPTLTNGQRGDVQLTSRGSVAVTLFGDDSATSVSFDGITSVTKIDSAGASTNATSVKASPGRVIGIECTALDADVALLSMRGKFSGTTLAQDVNGAAATPGSATGVTALNTGTTRLRVGSGNSGSAGDFWKGPIRHVLILRGLLPAKEEALMRAWAIADVI